jgi:hypothetical protein
VSLFRIVKYSSVLFFFGKYKLRIFRVVAVLLFAGVTSLLYQDIVDYLEMRHPDAVIYALVTKVLIVYGALIFVLLQFRPEQKDTSSTLDLPANKMEPSTPSSAVSQDRLAQLEDVTEKATLKRRYDKVINPDK